MTSKVSVITVVYNNVCTIESTIESVMTQEYRNIEHIIIDGGSTDGTVEKIEKYRNNVAVFVSEPDDGIYDAMNKGIRLATGNLIGFLNADDFYADSTVISTIVETMGKTQADCYYGDLEYVDKNSTRQVIRRWKARPYESGLFEKGWHPPHPTFFVRNEIFAEHGGFDTSLAISADYELMLRFLRKIGLKSAYIPRVMVKMRTGGTSGRNFRQIFKANQECYKAWKINNLKVSPLIMLKKPLLKIGQLWQ